MEFPPLTPLSEGLSEPHLRSGKLGFGDQLEKISLFILRSQFPNPKIKRQSRPQPPTTSSKPLVAENPRCITVNKRDIFKPKNSWVRLEVLSQIILGTTVLYHFQDYAIQVI